MNIKARNFLLLNNDHMSLIIRTFAEYEEGFTVGEESWLGLKQLAELTKVVVTNVFQYNVQYNVQRWSMVTND